MTNRGSCLLLAAALQSYNAQAAVDTRPMLGHRSGCHIGLQRQGKSGADARSAGGAPRERFSEPPPLSEGATPAQIMAHKVKTKPGWALFALRKQTVEPVFVIIKSVLDFRQFSLRGLKKVTGEWALVCLA
jgi:hypothetical protein